MTSGQAMGPAHHDLAWDKCDQAPPFPAHVSSQEVGQTLGWDPTDSSVSPTVLSACLGRTPTPQKPTVLLIATVTGKGAKPVLEVKRSGDSGVQTCLPWAGSEGVTSALPAWERLSSPQQA